MPLINHSDQAAAAPARAAAGGSDAGSGAAAEASAKEPAKRKADKVAKKDKADKKKNKKGKPKWSKSPSAARCVAGSTGSQSVFPRLLFNRHAVCALSTIAAGSNPS